MFLLRLRQLPQCEDQTPTSVPPPAEGRSSPTNTSIFPPCFFVLPSFVWVYIFFSAGQVLLSALSCSACTSVSEGVFLMYPWREMYSTSTYSSTILFLLLSFWNIPFLMDLSQLQKYSLSCIIFIFSFPIASPFSLRVVFSNEILRHPSLTHFIQKILLWFFWRLPHKMHLYCSVFILLSPAAKQIDYQIPPCHLFLRDRSIQTLKEASQGQYKWFKGWYWSLHLSKWCERDRRTLLINILQGQSSANHLNYPLSSQTLYITSTEIVISAAPVY